MGSATLPLLPCGKLQRPDSKANDIAWVQCFEFSKSQFNEMIFVSHCYCGRESATYSGICGGFAVADDGRDHFAQGLAVAQTGRISGGTRFCFTATYCWQERS